jgi:hypothetical protein
MSRVVRPPKQLSQGYDAWGQLMYCQAYILEYLEYNMELSVTEIGANSRDASKYGAMD